MTVASLLYQHQLSGSITIQLQRKVSLFSQAVTAAFIRILESGHFCHVLSQFRPTYRGASWLAMREDVSSTTTQYEALRSKIFFPRLLTLVRRPSPSSFAAAAPSKALTPPAHCHCHLPLLLHVSRGFSTCRVCYITAGCGGRGPEGLEAEGAGRLPLSAAQQQRTERRRLDSSQPSAAVQPDCWWY